MTLVKSAPKTVLPKKTIFWDFKALCCKDGMLLTGPNLSSVNSEPSQSQGGNCTIFGLDNMKPDQKLPVPATADANKPRSKA